ncbi:MAG: rod shape-determining protein MreC [Verrucomicrobiota bacterium]
MPSPRIDQARPYLTLGIVLLAWLVLPTVVKRVLRVSFYELQAPVEISFSYLRDLQDFWSLKTRSKNEIIEAARDQARGLGAAYELTLQENAALQGQIERLETLLRLPSQTDYRSEPARVVLRDFNAWWQRVTIRKGSAHGITVGSPVIYAGGVAGRVTEVHAYTSVVELISSPGVRIAATFEGDDRPVGFQGGVNAPFVAPRGRVEFVPLDIFATPGQPRRLVTSGLGGVYPAGLALGRVISLDTDTDGLFKTGGVQLDPRLGELNEVVVLVPLSSAP